MARMVRIYAILPGSNAAHDAFYPAPPFPVLRMEVSAANPEWMGSQAYQIRGWVIDIGTGITAILGPIDGVLQDVTWRSQNNTVEFTLPVAISQVAIPGGFVQIKGWVRTGAAGPGVEVDFATAEFVWA